MLLLQCWVFCVVLVLFCCLTFFLLGYQLALASSFAYRGELVEKKQFSVQGCHVGRKAAILL